ncbi:hypothetical protein [Tenacibaculum aiptasiae]|uniref:hypothetical protein n=1 Tax=Tenacibaculum aiptasiae TaxID=426481 RepID=UPI0023300612|nr:hypothetical protein [Tenacibaculum aiptasiae]
MKQYYLNNNELILKVKKSPFFIRLIMFLFSFLFFLAPILGLFFSFYLKQKFHFGFLIGIGIFGLLGFYMLRVSLWNTYGIEKITFNKNSVTYIADYKWFKDRVETEEIDSMFFSIVPVEYEEDHTGVLKIDLNSYTIECTTKMSILEIEELIKELDVKLNL